MTISIRSFGRRLAVVALVMLVAGSAAAQVVQTSANEKADIIGFGFAESFNDSTIYFTDLQKMQVLVTHRTHFLRYANEYAIQLRDYLSQHGFPHAMCVLEYAFKQKDIEKRLLSMRKRYQKDPRYTIKYVSASDFRFQPVLDEDENGGPEAGEVVKSGNKTPRQVKRDAKKQQRAAKAAAKKETRQAATEARKAKADSSKAAPEVKNAGTDASTGASQPAGH